MKSPLFAAGYADRQPWVRQDSHPIRAEILAQSAEKSAQFSDLLLSYLEGVRMAPEQARGVIESYGAWLNGTFSDLIYRNDLFDDDPDSSTIDEFYDEIMFNATNLSACRIWQHLLAGEVIPQAVLDKCQIALAVTSVNQTHAIARKHKEGRLYTLDSMNAYHLIDPGDSGLMALATHLDTMVAYLEAMKKNPHLVVLPTPPQFESSRYNSDRNIDLIAIDTSTDSAHGLQIKMNAKVSKRRDHEYDERYVTIIDGMNDLKNFVFMRTGKGSETIAVPMPGLYSAHVLAGKKNLFRFGQQKGKGILDQEAPHRLVMTRQMAFSLTDLAPSVNGSVSQHLSDIALRDLDPVHALE